MILISDRDIGRCSVFYRRLSTISYFLIYLIEYILKNLSYARLIYAIWQLRHDRGK